MFQMSKSSKSFAIAVALSVMLIAGSQTAFAAKVHSTAMDADSQSSSAPAEDAYQPPLPNEVTVSDHDFNQFIFPDAIVTGPIFPAGSPILGKPVYMAGNTQLLIQIVPGSDKPINMIVECANGVVYKFYLKPRPVMGVTHRVEGAIDRSKAKEIAANDQAQQSAPRGADVELLKRAVQGQIPEGFDGIKLPPPTRFNNFTVVPLAGWSDGVSRRIMSFSLVRVPGKTAVVAPPQFYRDGITAVMLDGDVVDDAHSPTLFVIEEYSPDEQ